MRVLAIGSHPDDVEIGCGGTLIKLAEQGYEVHQLLMTEGLEEIGFSGRSGEQEKASQLLKIATIRRAKLADTRIELRDAIDVIERTIIEIDPEYVFTHYPDDTHQDHKTVHNATISACRNRVNILLYESVSTENFFPTILVDISETLSKKIESVCAHESQEKKMFLSDYIRAKAIYRANRIDIKFAEGFVTRRVIFFNDEVLSD